MDNKLIQKGGNESLNLQNCDNVNVGLSFSETKELFTDLFELNYPKFREIARLESLKNIEKFSEIFSNRLQSLENFDKEILTSPDFHFILYKSIEVGARQQSDYLHNILGELLVKRIGFDKDDTIKTILNESISTINKVSSNQLKMLTFSFFIFDYWTRIGLQTWNEVNDYIDEFVTPFMDFNYKEIDLQHLSYSGCITYDYGFGRPSLSQIIKNRIPQLYPDLNKHKDEQSYIDEITKDRLKHSDFFFNIMDSTKLWATDTTSVGLMISSVNFEVQTGYKIPNINMYYK